MRLGLFVLVAACSASAPSAHHRDRYPLHPHMRSASGGPISFVGAVANPGAIPYTPGITFTCALRLAGGPTAMVAGAVLRRGEHVYSLPLRKIVEHAAPDPELAPGDIVTFRSFEE